MQSSYLTIAIKLSHNGGILYNIKLIEYPNGTYQIRKYSSPVGKISLSNYQSEIEPFSKTEARLVKEFCVPEENQRKSLAHTKSMVHRYTRCYIWEWFCTFTFSPEKIDRYNFSLCMKKN